MSIHPAGIEHREDGCCLLEYRQALLEDSTWNGIIVHKGSGCSRDGEKEARDVQCNA